MTAVLIAAAWFVPVVPLGHTEFTVSYTLGQGVVESPDGSRAELKEGSTVGPGDRIVIPQGGSASLTGADGHSVTLTDSTSMAVESGRKSLIGGRMHTSLDVDQGKVRVSGEARAHSTMDIGLPNGVAGVRGTDVSVSAGADRATVSLHDGSLSIKDTPGEGADLSPGQGAVLTSTGAVVASLPVRPRLQGLTTDTVIVRSPDTKLAWGRVAGANSYVFELGTDETFSKVRYSGMVDTTAATFPVLDFEEPLFVRVQAVTDDGLLGLPSSALPVQMAPHWAKGVGLREQGDTRGSLEEFKLAMERFPQNPDLMRDMGWSLYLLGRHKESKTWYEQARALAPDDPELLVELARVDFWLKDYQEAVRVYKSVLATHPQFPDALWGLGDTYRVLGRRAEALQLVQQALKVQPDHPYARGTLQELRAGG